MSKELEEAQEQLEKHLSGEIELSSADLAEYLKDVKNSGDGEHYAEYLEKMDTEDLGDVAMELPDHMLKDVIETLPENKIVEALEGLESDDATDLLQNIEEIDETKAQQLFDSLELDSQKEISKLINYEENEWRYLVPDENETKWFWSEDDYLKWRFPNGDKTVKKPSPSNALKNYTLTFSCKDVRHVLVSDDEFKSRLLDFIKGLTTIGGESALEDQRNVLRSKIITLKEIEEDF